MEEILASIRRIISEDDAEPLAPPPHPTVAPVRAAPSPTLSTDAIDALFATRSPEPRPAAPEPVRAPLRPASSQAAENPPLPAQPIRQVAMQPPRIEVAHPRVGIAAAPRRDVRPQPAPAGSHVDELAPGRPLLSVGADAAVNSAFGNLAGTVLASGGSRTLEDLVKEMLRPMLKAWLDTNLPPLVERLVRDEIERVSRGR
ncbi:PopZ family protein [Kaistia algarum]|uniref:PopZ family protein n=1 Tax=Kaistia algarum TaxID=2083279 RepID=UPI002B1DF87E|nr:DUF2497 domain-containing protein [Kaistia algarum]